MGRVLWVVVAASILGLAGVIGSVSGCISSVGSQQSKPHRTPILNPGPKLVAFATASHCYRALLRDAHESRTHSRSLPLLGLRMSGGDEALSRLVSRRFVLTAAGTALGLSAILSPLISPAFATDASSTASALLAGVDSRLYDLGLDKFNRSPGRIIVLPSGAVEKSPADEKDYRAMTLANGLRVLLTSDPKADTAAAALNVRVGHFSDPKYLPGLAHFCEHMLFLGTEKYPR